jgi:hypothetical protein
MTTAPEMPISVRYEGDAVATEIWGMTQANFTVQLPDRHAKEVAVMLNDAAARYLAEQLDQPDTPEFRKAAAQYAGRYWVEEIVTERRQPLDSAITMSRGTLDANPQILEYLKRTRA